MIDFLNEIEILYEVYFAVRILNFWEHAEQAGCIDEVLVSVNQFVRIK